MKTTSLLSIACLAISASSARADLIAFNAEGGSSATTTVTASLGSDFDPALSDVDALGGQYITSETDFANSNAPGNAGKVASYTISFNTTGNYDLYAKLFVGPAGVNDDSFFVGNGFGTKGVTTADDWQRINGLAGVAGISSDYTWVNITGWPASGSSESAPIYNVAAAGDFIFEIGGREDGLRIDAFAFGTSGETFTASQLDAATVVPEPSAAPFQLTITPATLPDTGFDLEWDSQAGKLYNLRTSPDLSGAIAGWTLVTGGEDIAATPPTNSFNVDPDGTKRFYAVEEFDVPPPPPLLSEDFEEGDGGFTVATAEGTEWERGAPDSSGVGGTVDAGNDGSANAWGTNLGTVSTAGGSPTAVESGFFIDRTETALRSPVIDLTGVSGAELTFAEALDFPDTDSAVVNLINATTDDVIAQIHLSVDPEINNDAAWNSVGPIDLAAGVGQEVRIEWRFEGTGGTNDDFMGWYIDDVVVTGTTP